MPPDEAIWEMRAECSETCVLTIPVGEMVTAEWGPQGGGPSPATDQHLPVLEPSQGTLGPPQGPGSGLWVKVRNLSFCFHLPKLRTGIWEFLSIINLLQVRKVKVKSFSPVRLFATPVDCSPPGFSIHGILQARILEWVAISFSRDLPDPGIETVSLVSPALAGGCFTTVLPRKP